MTIKQLLEKKLQDNLSSRSLLKGEYLELRSYKERLLMTRTERPRRVADPEREAIIYVGSQTFAPTSVLIEEVMDIPFVKPCLFFEQAEKEQEERRQQEDDQKRQELKYWIEDRAESIHFSPDAISVEVSCAVAQSLYKDPSWGGHSSPYFLFEGRCYYLPIDNNCFIAHVKGVASIPSGDSIPFERMGVLNQGGFWKQHHPWGCLGMMPVDLRNTPYPPHIGWTKTGILAIPEYLVNSESIWELPETEKEVII